MAFADLMLGALLIPLYIYIKIGMDFYKHWAGNVNLSLTYFYVTGVLFISLAASLFSATSISCERFYVIYRPFKHRTLTVRTYRIVIFTVWTLAALDSSLQYCAKVMQTIIDENRDNRELSAIFERYFD